MTFVRSLFVWWTDSEVDDVRSFVRSFVERVSCSCSAEHRESTLLPNNFNATRRLREATDVRSCARVFVCLSLRVCRLVFRACENVYACVRLLVACVRHGSNGVSDVACVPK